MHPDPSPPRPAGGRPARSLALACLAAIALSACGIADPVQDQRGNLVDDELIAEIVPGVQTRSDVAALLGTPTATTVFGEESWFYIGGVTRTPIGRVDQVVEQRVVTVRFDNLGVVRGVEVIGKDQAAPVDPVARVTPTPGNDVSFLGLLFGNIGRFSPGGEGGGRRGPGAPGI